jgi:hypothetical protein
LDASDRKQFKALPWETLYDQRQCALLGLQAIEYAINVACGEKGVKFRGSWIETPRDPRDLPTALFEKYGNKLARVLRAIRIMLDLDEIPDYPYPYERRLRKRSLKRIVRSVKVLGDLLPDPKKVTEEWKDFPGLDCRQFLAGVISAVECVDLAIEYYTSGLERLLL